MAYLITSNDDYRDLTHDDAYRSYLITRADQPNDYRFGRTREKPLRVHARRTLGRVNGFLKNMIAAIANSKLRRMERELELRGIRFRSVQQQLGGTEFRADGGFAMRSPALIRLVHGAVSSLLTLFGPSRNGSVKRYHPEHHYMRGPGPKWREKHSLGRASAGGS